MLLCNQRALLPGLDAEFKTAGVAYEPPRAEGFLDSRVGRLVLAAIRIACDADDYVAHRVLLGLAAVQETVKLYREGRLGELRTRERKPLKPLKPAQIRAIRKKWGASQPIFANVLNVPKKTYISWESGYKNPSGAALKLLMIAKEKAEALLVT